MTTEEIFTEYEKLLSAGNVKEAGIFLEGRARAAEKDEPLAAASCWNELTGYWRVCGNREKSCDASQRALAILGAKRLGQTRHYAVALLNYATAKTAFGDTDGLSELYEKIEELFQKTKDIPEYTRATFYNSKAQLLMKNGLTAEAEECFRRSLELLEGMEDAESQKATCRANMAYCAMARRDTDEAEALLSEAEAYFAASPDDPHANVALSCRGRLEFLKGNCAAAAEAFQKLAAGIETRYGRNMNYAMAMRSAAKAYETAGRAEDAARCRACAESSGGQGQAENAGS